jgi:hypothetical protein
MGEVALVLGRSGRWWGWAKGSVVQCVGDGVVHMSLGL